MTKNSTPSSVSEQILEQLSLAVILIDKQGKVMFANQQAVMLFGLGRKKLIEQPLLSCPVHHTFPTHLLKQLWETEQPFSDHEVEWVFIDGRHAITEVNADLAMLNEEAVCLLQIRTNDSLRKLNQENTQKHHISASRHLIRGLAHEIKNPLGGIRGAAQLLSRSLPSEELKEFTQMIIEQADRLRDLVDRLLGPNTPPKREATNIHSVLERVYSLVRVEAPNEVCIERDYDPSLPITVLDPNQVEQAILNIVQNGIQALRDYTDTAMTSEDNGAALDSANETKRLAGPTLIIRTRFEGAKVLHGTRFKKVLKVSVIDNGPGVSEELKGTLFYPMITSKSDGNGLGLSISQTLIDQHQGQIELESWPGQTEFIIYLPVVDAS